MTIIEHGFYVIEDSFFNDFDDGYLKGNKTENRPHYYAFIDNKTGLLWIIPLSQRIQKYEKIINDKAAKGQPCDILHMLTIANRKECLLIQDMFPITPQYIKREFTIANNHLKLLDKSVITVINKKARKVLALIRKGVKFTPTQPNVLEIEKQLLATMKTS